MKISPIREVTIRQTCALKDNRTVRAIMLL